MDLIIRQLYFFNLYYSCGLYNCYMLEYKNKILNRGRYIIMEMHGALAEKKLFIFDMDGTVYLGEKAFDGAIDFIKNLRAARTEDPFLYQ